MASRLISAIGAGGKTTALRCLAQHAKKHSVLLTTTTHILPIMPPECRVSLPDPDPELLLRELRRPGIVCAGIRTPEGKLGRLDPGLLSRAVSTAQLTLYEGDGSHRLPLKLHRPDEPVLLPGTDVCLIVAGLSALGQPVGRAVHRYERNPDWSAAPGLPVGPEEVLFCVLETAHAAALPIHKIRVLLNQADTLDQRGPADWIASELGARGLDCRVGSLRQDRLSIAPWILG